MSRQPSPNYTCSDYRNEMRLLSLKTRLEGDDLTDAERAEIEKEIESLESAMGM